MANRQAIKELQSFFGPIEVPIPGDLRILEAPKERIRFKLVMKGAFLPLGVGEFKPFAKNDGAT
jgi:hypothetical protein